MKIALFYLKKNQDTAFSFGSHIEDSLTRVVYYEIEAIWNSDIRQNPLQLIDQITHVLFILSKDIFDYSTYIFLAGLSLGRGIPFIVQTIEPNVHIPEEYKHIGVAVNQDTFENLFISEKSKFIIEDKQNKARKELLDRGISCFDENFASIVGSGNADAVELFLDAGFNPELTDSRGNPLLTLAVRAQFPKVTSLLILAGADVNRLSGDRGYSPLMDAVQKRDIAMVKLLLENHASPDLLSKDGQTALIICAGTGDEEMAELLVSNGADPEIKDYLGMSAIGYAKLFKNQKLLELFNKSPA